MIQTGLEIAPGDPVLLTNLGVTLSALGYKAPDGMFKVNYKEKIESTLVSLDEISSSVDPEEVMECASYVCLPRRVKRNNERQKKRLEVLKTKGSAILDNLDAMTSITNEASDLRKTGDDDVPPYTSQGCILLRNVVQALMHPPLVLAIHLCLQKLKDSL